MTAHSSRFSLFIPIALAFLALTFGIMLFRAPLLPSATISSEPVAQARLAPGTDALLKQTASHLSKLSGGISVGGLPSFRPPGDDERFKEKIKNSAYTPKEANYWLKEINNFLQQIIKKNPKSSLREILARQGLNEAQTENYLGVLQRVYEAAAKWEGKGVNSATLSTYRALLKQLGVTL